MCKVIEGWVPPGTEQCGQDLDQEHATHWRLQATTSARHNPKTWIQTQPTVVSLQLTCLWVFQV